MTLHEVASYRPGNRDLTRAIALAGARAFPGRAARDVPAGLDVIHYPVTVPIPATTGPRIVTLYDVQHHDLPRFFSLPERRYRRWAYDGAARGANVVITSSEYTRRRVVELIGIRPERIEAVPLGIDHERFRADDGDDAALLDGLELPPRFLLYPANLWPHKNHGRLLEALELIEDGEIELVLTGQDYGRLGQLPDRARHLGHLPPGTLPALYRAAEALVFPSLYEGFGSPPLEAMACGCPVAASDRGSLPEICGDAALIFDPGSAEAIAAAIDRLLSDRDLRETLTARGLTRASQFTWEASARLHRAIYERVAATSR